jgi:predicted MFS family arabinose efflux permease
MTSQRDVLRTPGFAALLTLTATYVAGIMALVSVAPLWVVHEGGTTLQSGLVASTFPVTVVFTLLFVPAMGAKIGIGPALRLGILALSLPAPLMAISGSTGSMMALTAVRGFGCATMTVLGSAVLIDLVEVESRMAAAAMYSLAVTIPTLLAVPLSVMAADVLGFRVVLCAAGLALLGLIPVQRLAPRLQHSAGARRSRAESRLADADETVDSFAMPYAPAVVSRAWVVRNGLRPAVIVFAVSASIGGGALTFLPQATASPQTASLALFVLGSGTAVGRWAVGLVRRSHGGSHDVLALTLTASGLGGLAIGCHQGASAAWLDVAAMLLAGLGYGALQGRTLVASFHAVPRAHYDTASALWTFATNVGMATGSAILSALAYVTSFSSGFWFLAAGTLAVTPLARGGARIQRLSKPRRRRLGRKAHEVRPECS